MPATFTTPSQATRTASRPTRRKVAKSPTIPLPSLAAGWSPACREIVIAAYDWHLNNLPLAADDSVENWTGKVPRLDLAQLLFGSYDLAIRHPELAPDALMGVLHEAMRFTGFE